MARKRGSVPALRERLEAERVRLQSEALQLNIEGVEQIGHGNHMADDASDAFEQAKSLTLRRNVERLLAQVRDALHRLDDGTYGVCLGCGSAIDSARLEVLPYASLCLRCQERAETR